MFVRSGTAWSQQAYLKASNTELRDAFGTAVAICGDTIAVATPEEDSNARGVNGDQTNNNAPSSGAAYVFLREDAQWSQEAYLKASNAAYSDLFGAAVSVAGDRVAVGARAEDSSATGVDGDQASNGATNSGAAYVFVRSGGTWVQEAYLKASNTGAGDQFGTSLALSGERLLAGAPNEDSAASGVDGDQADDGVAQAGAAYVFARAGTSWSQEAYLKASSTDANDKFGQTVALTERAALVGAPFEDGSAQVPYGNDDNLAIDAGAAYLFERHGSLWVFAVYVKASNAEAGDELGQALALAPDLALVGAPLEDSNATGVNGSQGNGLLSYLSGAAYAFQLCPPATVAFRNAGSNPASYTAFPFTVGSTFSATVDNNLAAQPTSLLFAFDTPTSFTLNGGQVLLCVDQANGEIFTGDVLAPTSSAAGVDSYSLAVPNDPSLAGFALFSQAIQFGNPPFALSNAQDLTIGSF